jgi:signal transduction histidine kinase
MTGNIGGCQGEGQGGGGRVEGQGGGWHRQGLGARAWLVNGRDRHRLDIWEGRELPLLGVLPYLMLAFCVALTLILRGSLGAVWRIDLGLCGLAGAWLATMDVVVPAAWRDRPWVRIAFFVGLVTIMTAMIVADPWFGFFTFTGYFYAGRLPAAAWRVLGVIAVAVLTGTSQAGGFPTAVHGASGAMVYFGVVTVNLGVAGAFTWFGWVASAQRDRRARLVDELSEANQRLEATLAENAGLHEQLLTQAREAGIQDERQRMAREIHDTLAQGLTGIITQLQAAEQAGHDPVERRRHFETAIRLARDSLSEARRSVDALRPEPLEQARLGDAIAAVAEKWSSLHGVPAEVVVTGTARPLPPETEVVLLRAAQEGLANVAKHAAASRAWLTLSYMDSDVALDIRDDGRGFAVPGSSGGPAGSGGSAGPSGMGVIGITSVMVAPDVAGMLGGAGVPAAGGFGLMAMRQRVEGLAGTLQVESEPGCGTVISACVPADPFPAPRPADERAWVA